MEQLMGATMSANGRLAALQSALSERGVQDVKFCFSLSLNQMPASEVAGSVSDFLYAYLNNKYKVIEKIGDSTPKQ
jgi:hypothetical protein